jgi:hypothetical protein
MDACTPVVPTSVQCEDGYTFGNKAYDKAGKLVKEFKPVLRSVRSAFFDAVAADGHAVLRYREATCRRLGDLGNIAHRRGRQAAPEQIRERLAFNADFLKHGTMSAHLDANGTTSAKRRRRSPVPAFDPAAERFTGDFADELTAISARVPQRL